MDGRKSLGTRRWYFHGNSCLWGPLSLRWKREGNRHPGLWYFKKGIKEGQFYTGHWSNCKTDCLCWRCKRVSCWKNYWEIQFEERQWSPALRYWSEVGVGSRWKKSLIQTWLCAAHCRVACRDEHLCRHFSLPYEAQFDSCGYGGWSKLQKSLS